MVERSQDGGGTLLMQATYSYDVFNQRVQSQEWTSGTGTVTFRYSLDQGNVWADLDGSSTLVTRRVFGDQVDQVLARIDAGGTAAWYLTDRLGSVRGMTDGSGVAQATVAYDGFGNIATSTNPMFLDRYLFTGREWSPNTQVQYNRARYELLSIGRWLTEDPIRQNGSRMNLFKYARNDLLMLPIRAVCESTPLVLPTRLL